MKKLARHAARREEDRAVTQLILLGLLDAPAQRLPIVAAEVANALDKLDLVEGTHYILETRRFPARINSHVTENWKPE